MDPTVLCAFSSGVCSAECVAPATFVPSQGARLHGIESGSTLWACSAGYTAAASGAEPAFFVLGWAGRLQCIPGLPGLNGRGALFGERSFLLSFVISFRSSFFFGG